jgi:hypothetical protein
LVYENGLRRETMITFDEATKLMEDYIAEEQKFLDSEFQSAENKLVIIPEVIIERSYGWVFSYQPKRFLETGEVEYSILGNSPILIKKEDGSMYELGTHSSIESALDDYESGKDISPIQI